MQAQLVSRFSPLFPTPAMAPTAAESRVDAAVAQLDAQVAKLRDAFSRIPADLADVEWVKAKVSNMAEVDQVYRVAMFEVPQAQGYDAAETQAFRDRVWERVVPIDRQN